MSGKQVLFLITLPIMALYLLVVAIFYGITIALREYKNTMCEYWQYYHQLGGN